MKALKGTGGTGGTGVVTISYDKDLRDYFAARAMQAYMTRTIGISGFDEDVIAEMSYKVAEAMMRARDE
jgi:hypothetical protein